MTADAPLDAVKGDNSEQVKLLWSAAADATGCVAEQAWLVIMSVVVGLDHEQLRARLPQDHEGNVVWAAELGISLDAFRP